MLSQTNVTKSKNSENPNPTLSVARKDNDTYSLISQKFPTGCWIIDIGASDHMTGSLNMLSNYEPCDQNTNVLMADGTISLAKGKGTTSVGGLSLKFVLVVSLDLKCNLLLVSKLTNDKDCMMTFFQSYCVF